MDGGKKILSLLELNGLVRDVIDQAFNSLFWVEAELMELREVRGHCYMELVQKTEGGATPVARASAKCWRQNWTSLLSLFLRVAGQRPAAGMKLLLAVYPQFHEAYGFSWIVVDIDPTYTLGDMARRRQEIIARLKEEGVFQLNKELHLPLFCQHIAVISSETAAGYGDFCRQLAENDRGFVFTTQLFPAVMQGEQVEPSIIAALNRIHEQLSAFDCVVIIRGGGATSDMSGFDALSLAENVANFPLPVITGIGHDRDECILDMISHTRVKTPTAAATFLIERLSAVDDTVSRLQERLQQLFSLVRTRHESRLLLLQERLEAVLSRKLLQHGSRLDLLQKRMEAVLTRQLLHHGSRLDLLQSRLDASLKRKLLQEKNRLELLEQRARSLDPLLPLRRGYSITLHQGKAVKDAATLKAGDVVETRVEHGVFWSIVGEQGE